MFKSNKYLAPSAAKTWEYLMGNDPAPHLTLENDQILPQDGSQDTSPVTNIQMSTHPGQSQMSQTKTHNLLNGPSTVQLPDVYGNLTEVPNPALRKSTRSGQAYNIFTEPTRPIL